MRVPGTDEQVTGDGDGRRATVTGDGRGDAAGYWVCARTAAGAVGCGAQGPGAGRKLAPRSGRKLALGAGRKLAPGAGRKLAPGAAGQGRGAPMLAAATPHTPRHASRTAPGVSRAGWRGGGELGGRQGSALRGTASGSRTVDTTPCGVVGEPRRTRFGGNGRRWPGR